MQRLIIVSVLLSLLLAGCASTPQSTPSLEAATSAPDSPETEVVSEPTATTPAQPEIIPTDPPPTTAATPTELSSIGPIEYQIDASESSVSYEVGETFFNQNNRFNVAIGVTDIISGSIQLDPENPQNTAIGVITVDISQFKSDSGRRDRAIQDRFLESGRYPTATFTPTEITGLPAEYTPGEMLTFQVTGDLTVREAIQPVTFDVQASLNEGILEGQATTTILMSNFGIGPIQMVGVLGTEDEVKINFNFVARQVN
jgi:polyisoprenoid-binding protein YceI